MKRVALLVIGIAFLVPFAPMAWNAGADAQEELCEEFASQADAQTFMEENLGMADSLDPDGDGIACESLLDPGATPEADASPAATRTATVAADATAPVLSEADALDGRLGGTRESIEAEYGEPRPDPSNRLGANNYRYDVPGYQAMQVFYHKERAIIITLLAERPDGAPAGTSPTGWTLDRATDLAEGFLPADGLPGEPEQRGRNSLTPGTSTRLADVFSAATYELYGAGGEQGDWLATYRLNREDQVVAIVLAIGNTEGGAERPEAATGAEQGNEGA